MKDNTGRNWKIFFALSFIVMMTGVYSSIRFDMAKVARDFENQSVRRASAEELGSLLADLGHSSDMEIQALLGFQKMKRDMRKIKWDTEVK